MGRVSMLGFVRKGRQMDERGAMGKAYNTTQGSRLKGFGGYLAATSQGPRRYSDSTTRRANGVLDTGHVLALRTAGEYIQGDHSRQSTHKQSRDTYGRVNRTIDVMYLASQLYRARRPTADTNFLFSASYSSTLPRNAPSSLPTSLLKFSTSRQQSSGLRSFVVKQLTTSSLAFFTP